MFKLILCYFDLHKWRYSARQEGELCVKITRYCQRCERIEWALKLESPYDYMTDFRPQKEWNELKAQYGEISK